MPGLVLAAALAVGALVGPDTEPAAAHAASLAAADARRVASRPPGERAAALRAVAEAFLNVDADSAAHYAARAYAAARRHGPAVEAAAAVHVRARADVVAGRYAAAAARSERAAAALHAAGHRARSAAALATAGHAYGYLGDYERGLERLFGALDRLGRAGLGRTDDAHAAQARLSAYNGLGAYALGQRDLAQAEAYFDRALRAAGAAGRPTDAAIARGNLSVVAFERGDFGRAWALQSAALAAFVATGDRLPAAISRYWLAAVRHRQGRTPEALALASAAAGELAAVGERRMQAYAFALRAQIHAERGDARRAEADADRALALSADAANPVAVRNAGRVRADALVRLGRSGEAYRQLRAAVALGDSLYSRERAEVQARMQARFDVAQRQADIARLEAQAAAREAALRRQRVRLAAVGAGLALALALAAVLGRSRRATRRAHALLAERAARIEAQAARLGQQSDELRRRADEKEVLLKEVHHRVKNNLQVIASLLAMQERRARCEAARTAICEAQGRVASMALIHRRLYAESSLACVEMGGYLAELADALGHAHGAAARGIDLHVAAEGVVLDVETAIPLALAANELVSNALRHAFPDARPPASGAPPAGGRVGVRLELGPAGLELCVDDDGAGLPAGPGREGALGLSLVRTLAAQLDGTLDAGPGPGSRGTRFRLAAPAPARPLGDAGSGEAGPGVAPGAERVGVPVGVPVGGDGRARLAPDPLLA